MSHSLYLQKRTALLKRAEVQGRELVQRTLTEVAKLDLKFKKQRGAK